MNTLRRVLASALSLALAAACSGPAPAAKTSAPVTSALPGGTSLEVNLASPADGALVASPPGTVHVAGTVSLGQGEALPDTTLVASGFAVKYTQAPGAKPSAKRMGRGAEVLHVTGTGDPALIGRDAVGNESAQLVCPVPPSRK